MDLEKPLSIVWAIDVLDDPNHYRSQVPVLSALAAGRPIEVHPTYVLSPGEIELSPGSKGSWLQQYRSAAEKALDHLLRDMSIEGLRKSEVIIEKISSTNRSAQALAGYALGMGADMILVSSHRPSHGLSRLFFGGFSNVLVHHSRVPVMILRPQMKIHDRIRNVLVPTQFGARAKEVFRTIVSHVHALGARITLFHTIPHPLEPYFQGGFYLIGGSWIPVQAYFSKESDRHRRRAEAWAQWARHQGVDVEVVLDAQGGDIGSSIVYLAESRKADLIAMESRSGAVASTLIGSITRHVIRDAGCPVWTFHSKKVAQAGGTSRDQRRAA